MKPMELLVQGIVLAGIDYKILRQSVTSLSHEDKEPNEPEDDN